MREAGHAGLPEPALPSTARQEQAAPPSASPCFPRALLSEGLVIGGPGDQDASTRQPHVYALHAMTAGILRLLQIDIGRRSSAAHQQYTCVPTAVGWCTYGIPNIPRPPDGLSPHDMSIRTLLRGLIYHVVIQRAVRNGLIVARPPIRYKLTDWDVSTADAPDTQRSLCCLLVIVV